MKSESVLDVDGDFFHYAKIVEDVKPTHYPSTLVVPHQRVTE